MSLKKKCLKREIKILKQMKPYLNGFTISRGWLIEANHEMCKHPSAPHSTVTLFFSVFSFFLHSGTLCFLALGLVDIGFGLAQLKDVAKREMTRARASRSFICALSSKVYHHHLPTFLSTASNQSIEQIYFGILHTVYSSGLALESFTVHFVSSLCWIDGTCSSMHFRFNGVSSNLQSYLYPQHLRYAPQVLCLYVHFHRVFSRFVQGFFRVSLYRCFFPFKVYVKSRANPISG